MKRINGEFEPMRTQDRVPEAITCACCGATTSDGKRFCSEHLDHMPYAARVMREVRLQAAKRRLRAWGRRHANLTQAG